MYGNFKCEAISGLLLVSKTNFSNSIQNKFICRAETKEATIGADGNKYMISIIYSFALILDERGAVQEVKVVDVEIESDQQFYGF